MSAGRPQRRHLGPTFAVTIDLVRQAKANGHWLVPLVVIAALAAALLAVIGQTIVPWLIYPAL